MNRRGGAWLVFGALGFVAAPARAADPTVGDCLAAHDASLKAGNAHKLRAARAHALVCAAESCPDEVRKECVRRVEELNPRIPTVVFTVKDGRGADLPATRITMDGELLVERLQGTALSLDPGEHEFVFEAEGQPKTTKRLLIVQSEKDRREAITLGAAPPLAPPDAATPPPARERLGAQRVAALVVGGVGVVGLGAGAILGLMAMSKQSEAEAICPGACPTQEGVDRWSQAGSLGTLSTVAFTVGAVGLAAGAVLWFTAPAKTRVGLGPSGFAVRGRF